MVGGPAASGKSTISRLLARRWGLRWYSTDAHSWSHRARAVAQGLHDADDPSPGDFDRSPLIDADLDQLAGETPAAGAVVEGALVSPALAPLSRSVWLMPSATEQRRRLVARSGSTDNHHGSIHGHRLIAGQLAGTSAAVINVDGQSISETMTAVETVLQLSLEGLPAARSNSDRQQVIRYGNQSLADQLRIGIDNGIITTENQAVVRTFDCECGQGGCRAMVELRPTEAIRLAAGPPGSFRETRHSH